MAQYIKRYNTIEHYTLSALITTLGVLTCENEHVTDRYRGKNSVTIGDNPTEKIGMCSLKNEELWTDKFCDKGCRLPEDTWNTVQKRGLTQANKISVT